MPLLIWWEVTLLIWEVATAYLVGGWVGLTVIIGLVSVQVTLKLELPTGTELGKNLQSKFLEKGVSHFQPKPHGE